MRNLARLARQHFWGLLLIVVSLLVGAWAVQNWKSKHPGFMTVMESQAMDMTIMKPPVGAVPVATEVVHTGSLQATVTYSGSVAPLQEQTVFPRVEGYLKSLSVYSGDRVSAGQLLAVVDSPDLQTKLAEARAGAASSESEIPSATHDAERTSAEKSAAEGEVQAARSELARARAELVIATKAAQQKEEEALMIKAEQEYWKAALAREEQLLKAGAVSLQEFQKEKSEEKRIAADYRRALAGVDEGRANLDAARADIAGKEAAVASATQRASAAGSAVRSARQGIKTRQAFAAQSRAAVATAAVEAGYRFVRAPFSGLVSKRYSSPGQFVSTETPIIDVVEIGQVRLQANVADKDLADIHAGSTVTARFPKNPGMTLKTRITSIAPLADQASRTSVAEAIVPNPGHKLLPGDSVVLEIGVGSHGGGISVPAEAIVRKDGKPGVWIAVNEAPAGKTVYYCTMHPEVESEKQGTCPKCLMKLVPKTSGGNKKAHLVGVTTGRYSGDRVTVTSGISDGAEVIYRGQTYLRDGDTVFPTEWTEDGPKTMPPGPEGESMPGMEGMPGMKHENETPSTPQAKPEMKDMPGMGHSEHAAPTKPKEAGKTIYVCPMCPGVSSTDPKALCPNCGMRLVPKE